MKKLVSLFILSAVFLSGCSPSMNSSLNSHETFQGGVTLEFSEGMMRNSKEIHSLDSLESTQDYSHSERMIVKRGNLAIEASDSNEAKEDIVKILQNYHHDIISINEYSYSLDKIVNLSVNINSKDFEKAVDEIKEIGKVMSLSINSSDFTVSYIDEKAREKTLLAQEETLINILREAKTVDDLIKLESEIQRIRQQIEQSISYTKHIERTSSMSSLDIEIMEKAKPTEISKDEKIIDRLSFAIKDGFGFWVEKLIELSLLIAWVSPLIVVSLVAGIITDKKIKKKKEKEKEKK